MVERIGRNEFEAKFADTNLNAKNTQQAEAKSMSQNVKEAQEEIRRQSEIATAAEAQEEIRIQSENDSATAQEAQEKIRRQNAEQAQVENNDIKTSQVEADLAEAHQRVNSSRQKIGEQISMGRSVPQEQFNELNELQQNEQDAISRAEGLNNNNGNPSIEPVTGSDEDKALKELAEFISALMAEIQQGGSSTLDENRYKLILKKEKTVMSKVVK